MKRYTTIINLHICPDDKFYKGFIKNQHRFAPDTVNTYFIVNNSGSSPPKSNAENVYFLTPREIMRRIKENHPKINQVVFHALPALFRRKFLPAVPEQVLMTWIFYGYEYYHRRSVIREYLGTATRAYYDSPQNPYYYRLKFQRILDKLRREEDQYIKDLQRIDRFAHWNPAEYQMIWDRYDLAQMEYTPFAMGQQVHQNVPNLLHRDLLLGHSEALTVNHLDGIEALSEELIAGYDRVIIPFSYGANKRYEALVRKAARNKMGKKALFLHRFMNRSSYFNILSRVKLAWMPQKRGMGGGNLLYCLRNHIPVVSSEESVMYRYYTEQGFRVFSMTDHQHTAPFLQDDEKKRNQELLGQIFGLDKIAEQYRRLLRE